VALSLLETCRRHHRLEELVTYFGNGNRSAYLRATLKIMRSVMLADQLRDLQAYGQQRTAKATLRHIHAGY
jgi:hypothetical protein